MDCGRTPATQVQGPLETCRCFGEQLAVEQNSPVRGQGFGALGVHGQSKPYVLFGLRHPTRLEESESQIAMGISVPRSQAHGPLEAGDCVGKSLEIDQICAAVEMCLAGGRSKRDSFEKELLRLVELALAIAENGDKLQQRSV